MCTSLIGYISALILFCFLGLADGNVQNQCTKVVINSCKLRWSHQSQDFYVVSSDKKNDSGNSHSITGNGSAESNTWCILNPEKLTIQIQFAFQKEGTVAEFENCPVQHNPLCKSVCLAVDTSEETRTINGKAAIVHYVTVAMPYEDTAQNETNFNAWTTQRSSYPGPPNDNSSTGSPTPSLSQQLASRGRRSKRRCGKRCRGRRLLLKKLANDFLLELTKQARKLSVSNYSSLTRLLRQNSKLSSQIDKLRYYDTHDKRATLTYPSYAKSSDISYESLKNIDDSRKDEKRFKRDPGNRPPRFSDSYFCGEISYQDDHSKQKESTNRPSKVIDKYSGRWTAPSFPFTLIDRKSNILLDVTNFLNLHPAVLERLEISIQVLQPVNLARRDANQRMTPSVNFSSLSFISDNMTRPYVNNVKGAAAAVGGGFGLLLVLVMIVILCIQRRKQRWWTRSKARHCECPSISESENCLSMTESVEDRPSVSGGDDQVWSESVKNSVADNNKITLEVKKSSRGRSKARGSSNSSLFNVKSTDKASNRSTCQHTAAIRGSSQHDHCCIVCHIAGKPHKPVMKAQHYASQVITSTERHTQGAVGATLSDKSLNGGGTRYNSNGFGNSTASFPSTVRMPDGEERYRGGRGTERSLMSQRESYNVCIKPPPNRTIYSCEPLPFNNNGIMRSPPPPPRNPKSHKPLEHSPTGSLPPAYSSDISNSNNSRSAIPGNSCVCQYLMSHMDDRPPEYSDVVS